jgi:hypothetical protein
MPKLNTTFVNANSEAKTLSNRGKTIVVFLTLLERRYSMRSI